MSNAKTWRMAQRTYQRGETCLKCGEGLSPVKCGNKYCSDNIHYTKPVTRRRKFKTWWWL